MIVVVVRAVVFVLGIAVVLIVFILAKKYI